MKKFATNIVMPLEALRCYQHQYNSSRLYSNWKWMDYYFIKRSDLYRAPRGNFLYLRKKNKLMMKKPVRKKVITITNYAQKLVTNDVNLPIPNKTCCERPVFQIDRHYHELNQKTALKDLLELPESSKVYANVQVKDDFLEKLKKNNESKILVLNDDNFKSATLKYKLLLVMFYAPWCKYCHDMKPMFNRVAKELPKGTGCLAYCNAERSVKVALELNVFMYPTLKLFRSGKYVTDYDGPRRSIELIKFMVKHSQENKI